MTFIENRGGSSYFSGHAAAKQLNIGAVLATQKPTINSYERRRTNLARLR